MAQPVLPPHPALRATFSREGGKGSGCGFRVVAFSPLREKVPEGRMRGLHRGDQPLISASGRSTLSLKQRGIAALLLEHALEQFDFLGQLDVVLDHLFHLAHRMEHSGVIAAAETPADFGQGA